MEIKIDVDKYKIDNIIINCHTLTEEVTSLKEKIEDILRDAQNILLYDNNKELYLETSKILFFETETNYLYAHTKEASYKTKQKLYELESILPNSFVRISKSTIININQVMSIDKNISSLRLVKFYNSHKQVYVSRFYYKKFKYVLEERKKI